MPRFVKPNKSGVHIAACLALYRALLRQSAAPTLVQHEQLKLRKGVRSIFRTNVKLQSPILIVAALGEGYRVLQNLQDRVGDYSTVRTKTSTLTAMPTIQARSPHVLRGDASARSASHLVKPSESRDTVEPALPQVDSSVARHRRRRRVPKLVSACGIPMLRWGKYQSPRVSRIIRDKIKSRDRLFLQRLALQDESEMARLEDTWDEILQKRHGIVSKSQDPTWSNVWQTALQWTNERILQMTKIDTDRAREMFATVQRETALAKQEAVQRREERRIRLQARQTYLDHAV